MKNIHLLAPMLVVRMFKFTKDSKTIRRLNIYLKKKKKKHIGDLSALLQQNVAVEGAKV